MNYTNIFVLIFLLAAFTIGVSLTEADRTSIDSALDNATTQIENITIYYPSDGTIPNGAGLMKSLSYYVKFVGVLGVEIFRAGVHFGQDNPDYFSPEFIIGIMKLLVIALIIALLIKPVGYVVIFLVLAVIFIFDKTKGRRKKNDL